MALIAESVSRLGGGAIRQSDLFHRVEYKEQVMPTAFHTNMRLVPTERSDLFIREPVTKDLIQSAALLA